MSWQRPANVAKRFVQSLIQESNSPRRHMDPNQLRLLVVGVGFKRGQNVISNSPGAAIICTLKSEYNCHVEFADPLVGTDLYNAVPKMNTQANWNVEHLSIYDGIIVSVNQEGLDMDILAQLQNVKVHGYTSTLKNPISVPTPGAG
jgi:UDP-N-acetyl-D-mannosaminuronate dehydrogenase